ncbi:membrane protein insertase YidC [Cochlodiniinecator piscidefendens]|uniref:membrane protein insertase YidC n=1 Tax=Cochlodiniinecator piscidefendens TaxID=2715756 RepID=UPI00140B5905|nr:membrane protein insertase YidC [Cochlodiniinecator piscidefendens]
MDDQNKNLILAMALSGLVLLVWLTWFSPEPPVEDPNTLPNASTTAASDGVAPPAEASASAAPAVALTEEAPRILIETPRLSGSMSLIGGRIDTLTLSDYRLTLEPDSANVELFRPSGEADAYYTLYGWTSAGETGGGALPNGQTLWQIESGNVLTPETPVTLVWSNDAGLVFRRTVSVDDNYMFQVEQSVENNTGVEVSLRPYGQIVRHTEPDDLKGFFIIHEGAIRMADGELAETDYDDMVDLVYSEREGARVSSTPVEANGWIGFTDHYWMTTLIPTPGQAFTAVEKYYSAADIYLTEVRQPTVSIAPGTVATAQSGLFAGAKEWSTIRDYERSGIQGFLDSIDWGWFFFLTKPIFAVLHWLNSVIGNMGWSIIALTLLIKALLLPLAYKSYVSMARMKEIQPEMEKLKERAGDDRQKLQQEMMKLYKEKKVNPAAGCLPILLQIPIFFSLYKVIFVTLELRQAPWIGWIKDLSAPDPSSFYNLWGILPWAAPEAGTILATIFIGILPLILGISMWLQQKLNPAPTDATQAMVFAWMPWIFMFMLGSFPSGLVLYWIANNTITFGQQYFIMRSQGYKPDVLGNVLKAFKRDKSAPTK